MINSILIPEIVYQTLSNNEEIKQYVGKKIFPIIADFGTQYPYIAYSRTFITPTYTKDYYTEDTVGVEIVIASQDYLESLHIANLVRSLFECKRLSTQNMKISAITLTSISEAYDDGADAFVQRISFDFKVN